MNSWTNDPPMSEYHYYVFEQIEQRGLQFVIPPKFKDMYKSYLKEKKIRKFFKDYEEARIAFFAKQE